MEKLQDLTRITTRRTRSSSEISRQLSATYRRKGMILDEINSMSDQTRTIQSFDSGSTITKRGLTIQQLWEAYEADLNPAWYAISEDPSHLDAERQRVIHVMVRVETLLDLGLAVPLFEASDPFAAVKKKGEPQSFYFGQISFQVIKSPRKPNVFLVKTVVPKGDSFLLTENLVTAPNVEEAKLHWQKELKERLPFAASISA